MREVSGFVLFGDSAVSFLRRASVRLVMNEKEEPLRFNCDFLEQNLGVNKNAKRNVSKNLEVF